MQVLPCPGNPNLRRERVFSIKTTGDFTSLSDTNTHRCLATVDEEEN